MNNDGVFSELLSSKGILVIGKSFWILLLAGIAFLFFFLNKIESPSINSFSVIFLMLFTFVILALFLWFGDDALEKPEFGTFLGVLFCPFLGWFLYEGLFALIIQNNGYLATLFLALLSAVVASVAVLLFLKFLVMKAVGFSNKETALIFKSWGTTLIMIVVALSTAGAFAVL